MSPAGVKIGPTSSHNRTQRKNSASAARQAQSTEEIAGSREKITSQGLSTAKVSPSRDDSVNDTVSFDAKDIIPTSKSSKTMHQLQKKGTEVLQGVTQYIDGYTRAVKIPPENREAVECFISGIPNTELEQGESSLPKDTNSLAEGPKPAESSQHKRESFKAFGIEARPTRAVWNEICYDFVSYHRRCHHGTNCHRIHPRDRDAFLPIVVKESVAYSRMRNQARAKRETTGAPNGVPSAPLPTSDTDLVPASTLPDEQVPARVKLPSVSRPPPSTATEASSGDFSARLETHPMPSSSRTGESFPATNHEDSNENVEHWDTIDLHKGGVDSSNSDGDRSYQLLTDKVDGSDSDWNPWKDMPIRWHTTGDEESPGGEECWSDSNETSDSHHQLPSQHFPHSAQTNMLSDQSGSAKRVAHPPRSYAHPVQLPHHRPKTTELCRDWLRNRCNKAYSCHYIHEDLEYDGDPEPEPIPKKPVPDTLMSRTLHQHIRATFGSGFRVTNISTGFESTSISISGLSVADAEIRALLKPFGQVMEIRRIDYTHPPSFKAFFQKTSEAFAAVTSLHGKTYLGCKPIVKPGEVNANRLVFRGNAVRFEWDAPCRDVYMGYSNRALADMAIEEARLKPYEDFMTVANLHVGIPAVGAVTVRFRYLPLGVDQDKMKTFGPHQGMVTAKPNITCTPQSMIRGFRNALFSLNLAPMMDLDIRHPPYRDGKMKAWAVFASSADAQAAAKAINGVSPSGMGGTRVSAFYMKSISFSLKRDRFQMVKDDIRALQNKLAQENKGYWLNVSEKGLVIHIRISGDDIKVLGRLKAEFERILNGEQLYDEGKIVWDPCFVQQCGLDYLENLEREYCGVTIEVMRARNTIRLWGVAEKRALVRRRIVDMVKKRRTRSQYVIRLRQDVTIAFGKDEQHGFSALEALLGAENITLDQWENRLTVLGDFDAYMVANDAVSTFSQRYQAPRNLGWGGGTCPACFTIASLPMKLPCGHTWCRSCLQRFLKVAMESEVSFPLMCHGIDKKCGVAIPLLVARDVLSPEAFEVVLNSAFSAHVHSHPEEFHYCPTPDCHQIYRSTPEGIVMQCPECLSQICTHCHSEAHEGLTCEEVRDGDDLFRQWALDHSVKQCPKCKVAIEKIEGCNHMMCAMCHTHICWVCLQTFENGLVIYGHMQSEHGGSGI